MRNYTAIVVAENDALLNRARTAAAKLGQKLRSKRAVKAAAERFGDRIAANPSRLRVETFDVAGFCSVEKDRPDKLVPVVFYQGEFVPVTTSFEFTSGEYRLLPVEEVEAERPEIVASCARRIASDLFFAEAMFAAIDEADPDGTLEGMSCDATAGTVTLDGDEDGKIARRLPRWIKVEKGSGGQPSP